MDYDEELGLLRGLYGSVEAEFRVIGPIKVHVDNKGIIDGLRSAKSGQCRFMEQKLGRTTWLGRKERFWWKWGV